MTPDYYQKSVETVDKQTAIIRELEKAGVSAEKAHFIATACKYYDRMGEKPGEPLEKEAFKCANYFHRAIFGSWIDTVR